MKRTALITMAIAGLALTGCGSDSGSSSGLSDDQSQAAEMVIDAASEGGMTLDEDCVNDVASQLSDEDADAIASGNDADVSEEGSLLSLELLSCADQDAVADLFIEGMQSSGQDFDEDCVRAELEKFDIADIVGASQGAEPPADVIAAMVKCVDVGG